MGMYALLAFTSAGDVPQVSYRDWRIGRHHPNMGPALAEGAIYYPCPPQQRVRRALLPL